MSTDDKDMGMQAAQQRAELFNAQMRSNPPRIVAEDGTSRSVFDETLEARIAARPAPKVTPADIEAEIASEHYFTAADGVREHHGGMVDESKMPPALELLTFAVLVLKNGFTVTGESACASPENFDAQIGREVARKAAVAKCWTLMGFALRSELTGHRPMATTPVLDTSKLPERYVVPANLRASALDESKPAPPPSMVIFDVQVANDINSADGMLQVRARIGDDARAASVRFQFGPTKEETTRNKVAAHAKAVEILEKAFADDDRQQDA